MIDFGIVGSLNGIDITSIIGVHDIDIASILGGCLVLMLLPSGDGNAICINTHGQY